ncbi:TIGR02710 family CRISPR-associated CARF protein [uncultured Meiothermus sp.]|mgnify:CR=1 FL=1|jgi:CRISPR-associated protein (TIGR02710 family)|uniref:TIGR02710 family CRISPR-associated CARF protein n=1 Tax=uncultured Meiothermus sp. TaxID=157471 RepID=UPI002620CEB7|nr:TIGR02710 family CRISPR-associated CARF protein [uncultured Meiothermus sp.]
METLPDKVLILSVGQTLEPLEFALSEHTPSGVVFVASQGSQAVAGELVRRYGGGLRFHTLLLDDPESLGEVFRKGREALQKALEWEARVMVADITGGTKTMSAGLVLALTGQGVTFSYVGGERRDAQGRVESGAERLRQLEDPTYRYGLREWDGFRRAWNQGDFPAACDFIAELLNRPLSPSEQRFYTHLKGITRGMEDWDLFRHKEAWQGLEKDLEPAVGIAEAWGHGAKVRVLQGLLEAKGRLRQILDQEKKPTFVLLADLLANARRREARKRYDDALARLYRAIELTAEADVFERTGIVLRDPETYPDPVQHLAGRAGKKLGLKEALGLAFEVDAGLKNTGTKAQRLYGDYETTLQSPLQQRHQSILAHGIKPVDGGALEPLWEYLASLGFEAAPAWPHW